MDVVEPALVPDASASREEMEALQREIASLASFEDDRSFDVADLEAMSFDAASVAETEDREGDVGGVQGEPVVAGVDQAFLDDRAVSAVVCLQGGVVVERASAVTSLEIPYIPGLLAFREGGPIVAALRDLDVTPDVLLFDGSGRIHYREAGLATHVGVVFDRPAVGVAKNLLCGTPDGETDGLPAGERVQVLADEDVTAASGTTIGYALQTRQYESDARHVNPLWVSPGHRVSAETAASLVAATTAGYKLPEPTRLADRYADDVKRNVT
jgi:deoxyribonuclease V